MGFNSGFKGLIWLSSDISFIFISVIMAGIYFDSFYTKLYKRSIMGSLHKCLSANFKSEVIYWVWKKLYFGRINRSIFIEINFCLVVMIVIDPKCIFVISLITRIVAQ